MAGAKSDAAKRKPWEYPHDYSDDPAADADRRELVDAEHGHDELTERSVRAYWQRRADYARAWLESNPSASPEERAHATLELAASELNAKAAGGMNRPFELPDMEQLYRATDNPLYVWAAISHALHGVGQQPESVNCGSAGAAAIPAWCVEPLRRAAASIVSLGLPGMAPPTSGNVATALGLVSQGYNAYRLRDRETLERDRTRLLDELQRRDLLPQHARQAVFPRIGDIRARRRAAKRAARSAEPTGE